MEQEKTISLQLPAQAESVRAARQMLRRFAAKVGADADAVAVAVTEAVTNAVQHAYRGSGEIYVRAGTNDDLHVTVADRGLGFDPKPIKGRSRIGLPLIGQMADAVDVVSGRDGVRIEMRFGLTA